MKCNASRQFMFSKGREYFSGVAESASLWYRRWSGATSEDAGPCMGVGRIKQLLERLPMIDRRIGTFDRDGLLLALGCLYYVQYQCPTTNLLKM